MSKERMTVWLVALGLSLVASAPVSGDDQGGYYTLSVQLEQNGKVADALDALTKIIDDRKGSYMVTLRKGWLLYNLGKYKDSIKQYKLAMQSKPDSLEAKLGVMLPMMAKRQWLDVEKVALDALKLDPKNYLAQSRLAYTYYNLQRWGKAEVHYAVLVELYPGDVDMRSGYGWSLFKQGKHEAAKKQFQLILQYSPTHSAALEGMRQCP
mgnify:CR=1 FL=1